MEMTANHNLRYQYLFVKHNAESIRIKNYGLRKLDSESSACRKQRPAISEFTDSEQFSSFNRKTSDSFCRIVREHAGTVACQCVKIFTRPRLGFNFSRKIGGSATMDELGLQAKNPSIQVILVAAKLTGLTSDLPRIFLNEHPTGRTLNLTDQ